MLKETLNHGTVVVERTINVPVARVYSAFADAKERSSWAAPSDTSVFIYDETDFRIGGRDVARCGARDDPRFCVESCYIDIVPEQRVVTVETTLDRLVVLGLIKRAPDPADRRSIAAGPDGGEERLREPLV